MQTSASFGAVAGRKKMRKKPTTKAAKTAKVGKVMHEFKAGTLHSGSKTGPKVKNPAQAKAIALSEAGMGRKKKRGRG